MHFTEADECNIASAGVDSEFLRARFSDKYVMGPRSAFHGFHQVEQMAVSGELRGYDFAYAPAWLTDFEVIDY